MSIAAVVEQFAPALESVKLMSADVSVPEPNQVLIRMLKSAINPSDLIAISGAYRSRITLPFFPGYEGVGIVEKIGSSVATLKLGDRVLPIGSAGCWQEIKVADANWCFRISDAQTLDQATTMYINPCTAWIMLHDRAKLRPGMNVIISAGASEIGRIMIRMLNKRAIEPVVTIDRASSIRRFGTMKVRAIVRTSSPTFLDEMAECTKNAPADLVLDAVGGRVGASLATCMRPGALFIHYGLLSGIPLPGDVFRNSSVKVEFFALRNWLYRHSHEEIAALLAKLEGLILDGTAESTVECCCRLSGIHSALRRQHSLERAGKILLSMLG